MDMKKQMDINGVEFSWNLEEGQLIFEQQDSVLFWISSSHEIIF